MDPIRKLTSAFKREILHRNTDPATRLPRIFYCHVPKCAGAGLSAQIRERLYADFRVGMFNIDLEASRESASLMGRDMMRLRQDILAYNLARDDNFFGTGHVYCPPRIVNHFRPRWHFVTLLRHPVDRWISEYVYNTYKPLDWAKNTLPLEQYLTTAKGRDTGISFLKYFSSVPDQHRGDFAPFIEEAAANLARFSLVGTVEHLGAWRRAFEERFGVSIQLPRTNTSPNREVARRMRADTSLMTRIERLCEPDLLLYQRMADLSGTGGARSPHLS